MSSLGVIKLKQLKYVVFDIETTGFSKEKNRIIQIAAIKLDGKKISKSLISEIKKADATKPIRSDLIFNGFINPGSPIPSHISKLTGIDDSMVENEPAEDVIISDFFDFVGDRILVAHNGIRFDVPFIEATARRSNLSYENFLCLDTLWLSRKLYPDVKGHKISDLIVRFDIKKKYPKSFIQMQHNALVDVALTANVLAQFIGDLEDKGKDQLLII